jgi:hypothetical protein
MPLTKQIKFKTHLTFMVGQNIAFKINQVGVVVYLHWVAFEHAHAVFIQRKTNGG